MGTPSMPGSSRPATDLPADVATVALPAAAEDASPLTTAPPPVEILSAESATLAPAEALHNGAGPARLVVAGYEILCELGRGGMGVVYRARQVALNRPVALKMILAGGHASADELARFRAEAEAVARLQHPNVVQIHEIGDSDGRPFFSLEYCVGGSLAHKLDGTPWPPQAAARLVETLARAVQAAHDHGIVHRDLKPANVLLTADGQPKLTDFGLAKRLDQVAGQTRTGAVLGTPSYMAPEQAGGRGKDVGPAADVYALGAILYELLSGRPPFKAATPLDTIMQVVGEEPVPLRQLQSKVPADLETVCHRCLQKDPARRYGSAKELAEDLGRFLAGEPILARRVGRAERLWRWCRRNPALATAGGLAGAATVAALVTLTVATVLVTQSRNTERGLRRQAELDAARLSFEQAYAQARTDPVPGLLGLARSLAAAQRAEDKPLEQSIRLQLASWRRSLHGLRAVYSHEGAVQAVVFSRDGKLIATSSMSISSQSVAFSPDGKPMATASVPRTAAVWDAATGKAIGAPLGHEATVWAVAFSPSGKLLLTGGDDGTARVWEAATGKPVSPPLLHSVLLPPNSRRGPVHAVAFSPDGTKVLTGSDDGTARLWNVATGKQIGPPLRHRGGVRAVAFSPDGKTVVTGTWTNEAGLWETSTGKLIWLCWHRGAVTAVAFSPGGKLVLTGGADGTARLWDAATGFAAAPPLLHRGPVDAVAFSPDGKTALTGSADNTARLWETATGKPVGPPFRHLGTVNAVRFSPDGTTVLTGADDNTARLWDVATGKPVGAPLQHQGAVHAVAFSPDGRTVLTGSQDSTAGQWDTVLVEPNGPPMQHGGPVTAVAFSPDGKVLLTGSQDKTARFWATASGKALGQPLRPGSPVAAVAFSPAGDEVITATGGAVQRWRVATHTPVGRSLPAARAVALSPDGKLALTGSWDDAACLWQVATGTQVGPAMPPQDASGLKATAAPWGGAAVAFSPDGKTLLIASGRLARMWHAETRMPFGAAFQHQGLVVAVAFSPDGATVLTGSVDGTARLWEAATGKPVGPPLQHQDAVHAVAFSADGTAVVTGSADGTAQLWEAATGKALGPPFRHPRPVNAVAFSPDGKTVATGCEDGKVRLWAAVVPEPGDPEEIRLWLEVTTGAELDERGNVHLLDATTWRDRRKMLLQLQVGGTSR
jgi:WD40 repeat protein